MIDIRSELQNKEIFFNLSKISKVALNTINNDKSDYYDFYTEFTSYNDYQNFCRFYQILYDKNPDIIPEPIEILLHLGKEGLAKFCLAYEFLKIYNDSEILFKPVLKALIARNMAIKEGLAEYENIFLSAVLTELATLFLKINFPNEYNKTINFSTYRELENQLWAIWGTSNAEASATIILALRFEDRFWKPVKHHCKEAALDNLKQKSLKDNGKILFLANFYSLLLTRSFHDLQFHDWIEKSMLFLNSTKNDIIKTVFDTEKQVILLENVFSSLKVENSFLFDKIIEYELNLNHNSSAEVLQKELKTSRERSKKLALKLEETNRKLLSIALRDPLTGAYNRRYLTERLEEEMSTAKRYGTNLYIIMTDIDHFKQVNDTYGHDNGDVVLKTVVNVMNKTKRKTDILARTGGEEFLLVCQTKSPSGTGKLIAEKIRVAIEKQPMQLTDGRVIHITMSFGVAKYTTKITGIDEFIKLSDDRLYVAKKTGRNKVVSE